MHRIVHREHEFHLQQFTVHVCDNIIFSSHRLHDVDLEPSILDHIDAIVQLPRPEKDGTRGYKGRLHVLAQFHEQWFLKVPKRSHTL